MPKSKRRAGAVAKNAFKVTVNQTFNMIVNKHIPEFFQVNPPTQVDYIHTVADFDLNAEQLPAFVLWQHDGTYDLSVNGFRLDEFLNRFVDPSTSLYPAVRKMLQHHLWLSLLGDDDAQAFLDQNRADSQHMIGDDPTLLALTNVTE